MKEYAMLVQTCSLPANGDAGSEKRAQIIAEGLAGSIEGLRRSLETLDDGGWQILSHDVLETNGSLVVSFLVFRSGPGRT